MTKLQLATRWDSLRRSFWFVPAVAMVFAALLGWAIGTLDDVVRLDLGVVSFSDPSNARRMLQTIATVTVTVIGISFSVTVVALQLASQQLGPRVLRTFQADALNKLVLSLFLGLFVYCIVVLMTLDQGAGSSVPELAVAVAFALVILAFGSFVAFIHNIVESLQASTLIGRIADDGRRAFDNPFPAGVGHEARDPVEAAAAAARLSDTGVRRDARAAHGGFVTSIDGEKLIRTAADGDLFVVQRVAVGDFAVTGAVLAEVWAPAELAPDVPDRVAAAFELDRERTLVQDVAFPVRQLADVALRALSPGLNDPTTAENALNALADLLVGFTSGVRPGAIRVDHAGTPRFTAVVPSLDDLVRLGFEQARLAAGGHPVVAVQLIALLEEIERAAAEHGLECSEARRQIELVRAGVGGEVPTAADEQMVRGGSRSAVP